MEVFTSLLLQIIPLYLIILLGFLSGRFLNADKNTVASILIYILSPVIVFQGIYTMELNLSFLSLPAVIFLLSGVICVVFFRISRKIWKDSTGNILALASASGNYGYFGIPLAVLVFGEKALSLAVLIGFGYLLFENTIGFLVVARGNHTMSESLAKLIRLPNIYAFMIGLIFNIFSIPALSFYNDLYPLFKGAFTVSGMMLIGLGLSDIKKLEFDWKFIAISFLGRFLVWPALIILLILLDKSFLGIYDDRIYRMLLLMSAVPLAANTIAWATVLKTHPEKASIAVALSTLFALFYIPLITALFIK